MLSTRLIRLIENHAEPLSAALTEQLKHHARTPHFRTIDEREIRHRSEEFFRNLGRLTTTSTEEDIRAIYEPLGRKRSREGIPLSELIYALILSKKQVLSYVRNEAAGVSALEIYGEEELVWEVSNFYDTAIYYTSLGHERDSRERRREHAVA